MGSTVHMALPDCVWEADGKEEKTRGDLNTWHVARERLKLAAKAKSLQESRGLQVQNVSGE
jgi:hypothetical protein